MQGAISDLSRPDVVNHPSHYTGGNIECIDAIEAATEQLTGIEAACTANAIKYLWRWKRKNGIEDLKKARWYINHLIDHIQSEMLNTVDIVRELHEERRELNVKLDKYTEICKQETLMKDIGTAYEDNKDNS
jgi:hypothetical protein